MLGERQLHRHVELPIGRTFVTTALPGAAAAAAAAARVGDALQGAVREGATELLLLHFRREASGELKFQVPWPIDSQVYIHNIYDHM